MNYLAIDTSNKNLTVVICKDGKIYEFFDENCGVNHSVSLMPKVEELALKADFDFNKADFFAVVTGAGSFTGIRIGVSTVKAMCFAFNKKALALTSFDTIAYNRDDKRLAIIDAGHNGYYVCGYDKNKVVLNPQYLLKDELLKLQGEYEFISGEEIEGVKTLKVSLLEGLKKAIEINKSNLLDSLEDLCPLYVRKSQAEEGRP